MDYIATKIDFYRGDYNGKNYESFYNDEIEPACNIISSGNNASALQSKVTDIKNSLDGLTLDWSDSVDGLFREYIDSCVKYLFSIERSIGEQFIGIAEPTYKSLKDLIENLNKQNTAYQTKFDEKPNPKDFYANMYVGKDENGKNMYRYQLDSRAYESALKVWEDEIGELAGQCIETIASIEEAKTTLVGVNSSTIKAQDTETPLNITVPTFNFEYNPEIDSESSTYTPSGTFNNYVKVTLGGVTFYALANIASSRTQEHDECLSYARANAIAITERNGYNIPLQGGNKNGCVYSSTDPNEIFQIAANEYKNGRSVVLEVRGSERNNTRHFVSVVGFEEGTDFNNIQQKNIFVVDSTSDSQNNPAGFKQLDTDNGGQKRYITSAKELKGSPNDFGTDYMVIVYSDVDYSTLPNTKVAPNHPYGAYQSEKGNGAIKFANV